MRPVLALMVALVAVVAAAIAVSTASSSGHTAEQLKEPRTVPDWFLDIADYYDRNPEVTPEFDFALLYDSRPRAAPARTRVGSASRRPATTSTAPE